MRTAFINTLVEAAQGNDNIWLLCGDMGYSVLEVFRDKFPDQFINVGVAEQNMVGIAAGLALSGKTVFIYSIINFVTFRCLEQIRNDACYHDANIKIVGVGSGFVYGAQGVTHHATQDMAILRALPRMTIISPSDPVETSLATRAIIKQQGTCYLRLSKANEDVIHKTSPYFEIGKAIPYKAGRDVTIICTGSVTQRAIRAAEILETRGIKAGILIMHTVKPPDVEAVTNAAKETGAVITLEEHSITGGLGSAVAEVLAEANLTGVRFKRLGLKDDYCRIVGQQEYLCDVMGLGVDNIVEDVQLLLK